MRIAVLGNTSLNVGLLVAADMSLAGHEVSLAGFGADEVRTIAANLAAGLRVAQDKAPLVSESHGPVPPMAVAEDPAAIAGAGEVLFLDTPPAALEDRIAQIAPALKAGQHLHIESHGYWVCLRAARILAECGAEPVTLSESTGPTHAGGVSDGVITPHVVRRNLPLGVFPAGNRDGVFGKLQALMPIFELKSHVLETNLESMNFLVHPAIALTNLGAFDMAGEAGRAIRFYQDGNSAASGILAEALDRERRPLVEYFGLPFRPLAAQINALYDSHGETVREAIANAAFYHALPDLDADIWRGWMATDIPLAHLPFLHLARQYGFAMPLHDGLVDIFGAVLETDFRAGGLGLDALRIDGLDRRALEDFLENGLR